MGVNMKMLVNYQRQKLENEFSKAVIKPTLVNNNTLKVGKFTVVADENHYIVSFDNTKLILGFPTSVVDLVLFNIN